MHNSFEYLRNTDAKCRLEYQADLCRYSTVHPRIRVLEDVYFLPGTKFMGGGLVSGDKYIQESFVSASRKSCYDYDKRKSAKFAGNAVYIGMFHTIWGHCITDNLKHLWFALNDKWMQEHNDVCYVYSTVTGSDILPDNFLRILDRLNIDTGHLVAINRLTHFNNLLFPEPCFRFGYEKGDSFTEEYLSIINLIERDVAPSSFEKIYFSRTKIKNGKDWGENEVENLFRNQGYAVFHPEELSLEKQISLLKGAQIFAATEGSVTHNGIFLQPRSNLVILKKSEDVNIRQCMVNEAKDLNVTYIDVGATNVFYDKRYPCLGPFFIYVSDNLSRFFKTSPEPFPSKKHLAYMLVSSYRVMVRKLKVRILTLLKK